jgi:hypothetical protein
MTYLPEFDKRKSSGAWPRLHKLHSGKVSHKIQGENTSRKFLVI